MELAKSNLMRILQNILFRIRILRVAKTEVQS